MLIASGGLGMNFFNRWNRSSNKTNPPVVGNPPSVPDAPLAPPRTAEALDPTNLDDFSKLQATEHMLRWFSDAPYAAIRSSIEDMLKAQAADSRLTELRVFSDPQWLTGARPSKTGGSKAILIRSAVAFVFALSVESQGELHRLVGVFTWAAVNLDQPGQHKHRVWIDLDGTLAEFGSEGELKNRIHFE